MATIEIEVKKPAYTFIEQLKLKWYGYSMRLEKWKQSLPNDGDIITLTCLKTPINNQFEKSIWIGVKGVVFDMDKREDNFCLRLESGSTMVCVSSNFKYTKEI